MEHRPLGRTGVSVSKLCLGAMMFGDWGTRDHDESIRIIHRALDAGINFIDTADAYSAGESEEIVGKALAAADATTSWLVSTHRHLAAPSGQVGGGVGVAGLDGHHRPATLGLGASG
jgi:aryl-alcohol dehydrogenase-like predicted oxidoreductase